MKTLREFLEGIVLEELHPELRTIAASETGRKQDQIARKIKELTTRGEATGIEGNMPKGSSRAYLKLSDPENVTIDGTPTTMKTGMKIAIRHMLDPHHDAKKHEGLYLGAMQMKAENGDYFINDHYRTLTQNPDGSYRTNEDTGILPPLISHDEQGHQWSHVGHVDDVTPKSFKELTKTPEFPNGVSHDAFMSAIKKDFYMNQGRYYPGDENTENYLTDLIKHHPVVQKFADFHSTTGNHPDDLAQIRNLGVWTHPVTGKQSIVARDTGFTPEVAKAYSDVRAKDIAWYGQQMRQGKWDPKPKRMVDKGKFS